MREHTIPVRLLLIGLPLTILLGTVVALPLFGSMGIGAAAHGITAYPLVKRYSDHAAAMRDEPDMPEMASITEMPLRLGMAESTSSRSATDHH